MKSFFDSNLFGLIIEAVFTLVFLALVLAGNVHFLTLVALGASAAGTGWYLHKYFLERNSD